MGRAEQRRVDILFPMNDKFEFKKVLFSWLHFCALVVIQFGQLVLFQLLSLFCPGDIINATTKQPNSLLGLPHCSICSCCCWCFPSFCQTLFWVLFSFCFFAEWPFRLNTGKFIWPHLHKWLWILMSFPFCRRLLRVTGYLCCFFVLSCSACCCRITFY